MRYITSRSRLDARCPTWVCFSFGGHTFICLFFFIIHPAQRRVRDITYSRNQRAGGAERSYRGRYALRFLFPNMLYRASMIDYLTLN
jgi:hypothetical protein